MNLAYANLSGDAASKPPLPGSLHTNRQLGQWIRVLPEGHVEIRSGKVEIGQGILTALRQIVAEEMDLALDQIKMIAASTGTSPNEAVTSGSLSIQESGLALRFAAAEARAIYLEAAATKLGTTADKLTVQAGTIAAADGRYTSYWALADDALLAREATGSAAPKQAASHQIVGLSAERIDLPEKIFGQRRFIHDLELPGMVYGRIVRPPAQAATLLSLDETRARASAGLIAVVRDGWLLGVLADTERHAEQAALALSKGAVWDVPAESLPDETDMPAWLRAQTVDSKLVSTKPYATAPGSNQPPVARTIKASFAKPYLAHASIGPSCALAVFDGEKLEVWSHSQGIYNLRTDLALAFNLPASSIIVNHVEGSGCYGHNPADDVAFDAAWLARAAGGRPVRLLWSRADELAWTPFSPAMAVDLEADLDEAGGIVGWRHTVWSNGHSTRPGRASSPALLGAWYMDPPFERQPAINAPLAAGGGAERNAIPSYAFPAWDVTNNRILAMPLRTSAMRGLGAFANVFAVESFMEQLAAEAGIDPIEYRLRYIDDPRARAVIELAIEKSGWRDYRPAEGHGLGFGYAQYKNTGTYCAVVAEIEAAETIRVKLLTIAVDVGLPINPDGIVNQTEGGAIQATSWALKEAVRFDRTRVLSDNWEDYPILRFPEIPTVDVHIVPSEAAPVGAGEGSIGPTAAAIGNAIHNALGARVRRMPFTPDTIVQAFEETE